MPNKNQANIPVRKQTKREFDNNILHKLKEKDKEITYDKLICTLTKNSTIILDLFQEGDTEIEQSQ